MDLDPLHPGNWADMPEHCRVHLCDRDDTVVAFVSPEDWRFVVGHRWRRTPSGYATRVQRIAGCNVSVFLHREVALRAFGPPPSKAHLVVDHINGDRCDNRRSNLRWATLTENNTNRDGFRVFHRDQYRLNV